MRVFRTTYKTRDGERREAAKWYVEFRDHLETVRRLPAFTDKKQSAELGRKVEKLVACRSNGEAPDVALGRWLEAMPERIRTKLANFGILDPRSVAAGKPLAEHIDEFEAGLVAKGDTSRHARQVANRVRRLFEACRFRFWNDLSASKLQGQLAEWRDGGAGMSIQTSNFYLQAAKQFAKWMVRDGRANVSPLDHLQGQNVRTDRRHDRRALRIDELRRLLDATLRGPERRGVNGRTRWLVYRLALETGLRAGEIRSLKRSSFHLEAQPATVTVEAAYSKRRRRDTLPLRSELAEALRSNLSKKTPEATAFVMPKKDRLAHVLRADLAVAREEWLGEAHTDAETAEREASDFLSYRDHAGLVADFHALRHTFITNLANSGVHPKVAQMLARHSTITLTMDRYTHTLWDDLGEAIERLPDVSFSDRDAARATGTDGRIADDDRLALCLARKGTEPSNSVRQDAVSEETNAEGAPNQESAPSSGKSDETSEKNGGSAWESNPPAVRPAHGTTVLKTAATTRCARTSALGFRVSSTGFRFVRSRRRCGGRPPVCSRPVQPRFCANSVIVIAQQPSDDFPTVFGADLDVALSVDTHHAAFAHARGAQVRGVHLLRTEKAEQHLAGHLDEFHGGRLVGVSGMSTPVLHRTTP